MTNPAELGVRREQDPRHRQVGSLGQPHWGEGGGGGVRDGLIERRGEVDVSDGWGMFEGCLGAGGREYEVVEKIG